MEIFNRIKNIFNIPERVIYSLYCCKLLNAFKESYYHNLNNSKESNCAAQFEYPQTNKSHRYNKLAHSKKYTEDSNESFNGHMISLGARVKFIEYTIRNLIYLEYFTTFYFAYIAIRFVLPLESILNSMFELGKPANCYIPGKLILLFAQKSEPMSFLFAMFNLSWRSMEYLSRKKYINDFDFINFILEPMANIELCQSTIIKATKTTNSKLVYRRKSSNDDSRESNKKLLKLMCCQRPRINSYHKFEAKLRFNRTKVFKILLENRLSLCNNIGNLIFLAYLISATPLAIFVTSTDSWYIKKYPGCDPELEEYSKLANLGEWSYNLSGYHRFLTIPIDVIENLLVYMESILGFGYSFMITYIINYDILSCWPHLHDRLQILVEKFKRNCYHHSSSSLMDIGKRKKNAFQQDAMRRKTNNLIGFLSSSSSSSVYLDDPSDLDSIIDDIQTEIYDNFKQIEVADMIVSNVFSFSLLYWLASIALIQYYYGHEQAFNLFIKACGCVLVTIMNVIPMSLFRTTLKSHKLICSLMAYDKSRYKLRFCKLLEFYTERNRSTYTLLQQYPYAPTFYMTIVGWTVSVILIVEKFAYH